jgi:hypothetical protein
MVNSGTATLGFFSVCGGATDGGTGFLRNRKLSEMMALFNNCMASAGSTPLGQASEQAPAR